MKHFKLLLTLSAAAGFVACTSPKNDPRYVNEPAREWKPADAPVDQSVGVTEMNTYDINGAWAKLKDPKADLVATVLKPLSRFVLNAKFVATPENRSTVFTQMITVFYSAFEKQLSAHNNSADFLKIKNDFYNTVFDGCSRDMKANSCTTADLFARQPLHMRIFTLLAREFDPSIEARLDKKEAGSPERCIGLRVNSKTGNIFSPQQAVDAAPAKGDLPYAHSDQCRADVEERYRRLAMAAFNKHNQYDDAEFDFAYMKYARLFAILVEYGQQQELQPGTTGDLGMSYSYLAQTNGAVFQTIIGRYQPTNYNDPEFKAFVNNFNPWTFSHKSADIFQYGTNTMFGFATKCCLYDDKGKLSDAVTKAIDASQATKDEFGLSFRQLVDDIKKQHAADPEHAYDLFQNLGILDLVKRIEDPKSGFYNEYFFVVDRVFRGHLTRADAEMVLRNTDPARTKKELPQMVVDYSKIYLVAMVVETNRFMSNIYSMHFGSEQIFQETIKRSAELTDHWHSIQGQIDSLGTLMGSYFKSLNLTEDTSTDYNNAFKILKAVNRNVHYLSVFPNMIVMTYYFANMNGSISFDNGWGEKVEINAATTLKQFFDGQISQPWFAFGQDAEMLDRVTLLYSMEYLLSTEALNAFIMQDNRGGGTTDDRSRFFNVIFTKYLDESLSDTRDAITKYEQQTVASAAMSSVNPICDYEAGRGGLPPRRSISFMDLGNYTYTGIGDKDVNGTITSFLTDIKAPINSLRTTIQLRRIYVQAMLKVIAQDLLRSKKIRSENDHHPDLDKGRELLRQLGELEKELVSVFLSQHRRYFQCALTLAEVEKRRAKRLYEEERQHLSQVFDAMKPLADLKEGAALNAKVAELNATLFTQEKGYRFDRIDGTYYRMSKYDLLMRMKKRIEADVFNAPTPREVRAYGATVSTLNRARAVTVYIPDGVERDSMVSDGTNVPIFFRGTSEQDRADFIRQGMAALGGRDKPFMPLQDAFTKDLNLVNYVSSLEEIYLLGPVNIGKPATKSPQDAADNAYAKDRWVSLPKEDLVDAYIKVWASIALDEMDVQNVSDFGVTGRYDKAFFQNKLFDRDGQTRLPFFFGLMDDINRAANMGLKSDGQVHEALEFARSFNSMQAFVFQPTTAVRDSVYQQYGTRVNGMLSGVEDLYDYLLTIEKQTSDATKLDPRLALPFYVESGVSYAWYDPSRKNMVDHQKSDDHRILIGDFIQQSGNFFGTRQAVKLP